jgi:hypothetical protein
VSASKLEKMVLLPGQEAQLVLPNGWDDSLFPYGTEDDKTIKEYLEDWHE